MLDYMSESHSPGLSVTISGTGFPMICGNVHAMPKWEYGLGACRDTRSALL